MKKIKYTLTIIFAILLTTSLFQGCLNEDFLNEEIKDELLVDNLYEDLVGFEVGLNGLYATLLGEWTNGSGGAAHPRYLLWTQGMDNVFAPLWGRDTDMPQSLKDRNNSEVEILYTTWSWLYEIINISNTIITRAENEDVDWGGNTDELNQENKNKVIGEARCVRAWAYNHLINLWGDVPLRTEESTSNNITNDVARANITEVENLMKEDLLFAIDHLPNVPSQPGKVSKAVAQHYLAELYLKMGEYSNAEAMANSIITSDDYSLVTERYGVNADQPGTPYSDLFLDGNVARSEGNTEVLWSWHREYEVVGGEIASGNRYFLVWPYDRYFYDDVSNRKLVVTAERGGRGIAGMAMTKWAINLYEENDDRYSEHAMRKFFVLKYESEVNPETNQIGDTIWIDITNTEEAKPLQKMWPSPRKNEWALEENPSDSRQYNDVNYIRLAETYFLLAEAQIKQNKLDEAAETINIVRRRSNASEITAAEVDIDFLLDERSRELIFEEKRKYVLVRNNKYVERVQKYNPLTSPNVAERDRLWPIPQPEIDLSPETMVQNSGY
ncbi:RagB/SusD family nutrient uptake outer membrane protein [uncultured Draconibacterium sp.]|uniref:RagB/SusD family nutrient uptake outer membrane protein n=1 Tax=uncultured Draconibacterium sp. TaxID=1573823 RepID=UPI002AA6E60B|nr:RagB/SusD family nutrient uptake outer membrane protein [uncultured Draconibacterium sp.]